MDFRKTVELFYVISFFIRRGEKITAEKLLFNFKFDFVTQTDF